MAFTLTDKIFGYFGRNAKAKDTYKDVDGKGINQRFNECLGEDYDENMMVLIDDFHDKLLVPKTCLPRFVEYIEYQLGQPFVVFDTETFRRKMIGLNQVITLWKGTRKSYDILYQMLGVTVDAIPMVMLESGFDSSYTLDDVRRFDSWALCCQHYEIELSGAGPQDAALNTAILRIARYLQPINGEIDSITYNGNPVPLS